MRQAQRACPQIWLGDDYGQHPEPDAVLAVARQHIPTLPEELAEDLRLDRLGVPPRPLPADHEETAQLMNELLESARRNRTMH